MGTVDEGSPTGRCSYDIRTISKSTIHGSSRLVRVIAKTSSLHCFGKRRTNSRESGSITRERILSAVCPPLAKRWAGRLSSQKKSILGTYAGSKLAVSSGGRRAIHKIASKLQIANRRWARST